MKTNGHKEEKEADLRLPDIHDSASSMSSEDRRFAENSRRNDFSGLDNERGTENHFSKKVDVKENTENSLMKNYEFQRDLRFTQCSKKLSRERYSYFPRFPSPKPMNKRERLKKELEKKTLKKQEETIHPGSLRTKEEYAKIFLSPKKV